MNESKAKSFITGVKPRTHVPRWLLFFTLSVPAGLLFLFMYPVVVETSFVGEPIDKSNYACGVRNGKVYHATGGRDWFANSFYRKLSMARCDSFSVITDDIGKSDEYVYYRNHRIEGALPSSFQVFKGSSYAKDATSVYCIMDDRLVRMEGINAVQFQYDMSNNYATDGMTVMFYCKKLDVDVMSFKALGSGYAVDKHNVYYYYYQNQRIDGAIPSSFELISNSPYTKDNSSVYCLEKSTVTHMYGVDSKTFQYDSSTKYATDGRSVLRDCTRIDGIDAASFQVLGKGYVIDKNNVYYHTSIIGGADVGSFHLCGSGDWARDSRGYYEGGVSRDEYGGRGECIDRRFVN